MSAPVPRRAETASSAGAMVPALASAARGRAQTAYRAFLGPPSGLPGLRGPERPL
ncbi:hypothetical protein [Actinacidiphila soli]|uniref:hypothetical protein n=1 Tax=Actinacidiphila soli TaxID=2487275 RepID=UPI0013E3B83E|nr:hypothetical protein [Actinacidiphila soli]